MCPTGDAERVALLPPPPAQAPPRSRLGAERAVGGETADRPGARSRPRAHRSVLGEAWRWTVTGAIFLAVALPLLALSLVLAIYWQARTDQTRPVEAIVVLGTAQYNGRPGPVLRARLDHALALYGEGVAPLVVVTGGRAPGDRFTEAEAAEAYLLDHGVPAAAIALEDEGRDSWASMQGVARLLEARGLSRVLLVSDGFHLFRVKLMARDVGLTAFASPARDSPIRQGGLGELEYVLREAAGVVAHLLRTR